MTTLLVLVVDAPPAALHDDDPVGWTAGYVRGALLDAGLVVHDVTARPDLVLGCQPPAPPTAAPGEHPCPLPWCRAVFAQPHHLKMHMRSHQDADCQHCGSTYKLTGLHSHEAHCRRNPANWVQTPPGTPQRPPERVRQAPRVAKPLPPPPPMPVLGPITKRKFDPDKVRAAQADAQLVGPW